MLQPRPQPAPDLPAPRLSRQLLADREAAPPFFGMLDSVIVDDPARLSFAGAVSRNEAGAVWTWLVRDIASDLIDPAAGDRGADTVAALQAITPELLVRADRAVARAAGDVESERRLRGQLGGSEIRRRLPVVLTALKCAPLLDKAKAFGRAFNAMNDDAAAVAALEAMPRQVPEIAAILLMAAAGQVVNPTRLVVAATQIAGEASETAVTRVGLGPLVDALLAHAQHTIPPLLQVGAFADIDLICRSVERFHRLVRPISANIEMSRTGRWAPAIAAMTRIVSDRLEPRLRDLVPDVNQAMRRQRDVDRLDSDRLLAALGGFYLLRTVRDCRDSLALNERFDETWARTAELLEMHLARNLDALRDAPGDPVLGARLDAGIKMAGLRFGEDYAQILRRARDGLERGPTASG